MKRPAVLIAIARAVIAPLTVNAPALRVRHGEHTLDLAPERLSLVHDGTRVVGYQYTCDRCGDVVEVLESTRVISLLSTLGIRLVGRPEYHGSSVARSDEHLEVVSLRAFLDDNDLMAAWLAEAQLVVGPDGRTDSIG